MATVDGALLLLPLLPLLLLLLLAGVKPVVRRTLEHLEQCVLAAKEAVHGAVHLSELRQVLLLVERRQTRRNASRLLLLLLLLLLLRTAASAAAADDDDAGLIARSARA